MKIYLVRHGESFDDIYNEFGSWSERELTPHGVRTAFGLADKLKSMKEKWEIVLTSPLKRAWQTAEIIAAELNLPMDEEPYLKERNTYGLLTGVNRDLAMAEYPEMYGVSLEGRYLPASERYSDFVERVHKLWERITKLDHKIVIGVTHGHVMTAIVEELFGVVRNSIESGSVLGIEIVDEQAKIICADGISFVADDNLPQGVATRKFKEE